MISTFTLAFRGRHSPSGGQQTRCVVLPAENNPGARTMDSVRSKTKAAAKWPGALAREGLESFILSGPQSLQLRSFPVLSFPWVSFPGKTFLTPPLKRDRKSSSLPECKTESKTVARARYGAQDLDRWPGLSTEPPRQPAKQPGIDILLLNRRERERT